VLLDVVSFCEPLARPVASQRAWEMSTSRQVGVKSAALTGGQCPPVYSTYHVFNLSQLTTPNCYLGHWGQMRTVSVLQMGTDRVTPEPTSSETHETECLLRVKSTAFAVGTAVTSRPPGRRRRSPAPGSHRTWRADLPHHALRRLVHSFDCYLFRFRFHGRLIFSLNRRP
jgi:hypothetical protein